MASWMWRSDITTIDITYTFITTHPLVPQLQGPLARARACQLNYQVSSLLEILSNIHENTMLPKSNILCYLGMDLAWTGRPSIGSGTCMEMAANL
jgi:hypothetical protein